MSYIQDHFIISPAVFYLKNPDISLKDRFDATIFQKVLDNLLELKKTPDNSIHGIITYDYDMITLHDLINNLSENVKSEYIYINLIFELLYSIYIMNINLNLMHNDLHFGNIMTKKLDTPIYSTYIINNNTYILKKYFIIRIYDFDRAYVKNDDIEIVNNFLEKKNIKNDKITFCHESGSCNKKSNKDTFVLLASLIRLIKKYEEQPKEQSYFISIIFKKIFDILTNYNEELYLIIYNNLNSKKVFWSAFCSIDRKTLEFIKNKCNNTYIPNIDIESFMNRYIKFMNLVPITPNSSFFLKKYIKYKQKYLELKNTIKC